MQTGPEAPAVSRSLIVVLRILLLAASTSALAVALTLSVREGNHEAGALYTCPMHPEVTRTEPGQCPICFMALEPAGGSTTSPSMSQAQTAAMADVTAIDNIKKHRITDYVRSRSLLLNVQELRGPAWVESDLTISTILYTDQLDALGADEQGTLTLSRSPKVTFVVRPTGEPPVPWDASTSRAHFRMAGVEGPGKSSLQPGQVGWVEFARRPREVLGVPVSAVLQSPEGPYVLVPAGRSGFEKRAIDIGETLPKQGFSVVLSGLAAQDRVVAKAAFFLDADRRVGSRAVAP